jgi:YD repeat-containing protein
VSFQEFKAGALQVEFVRGKDMGGGIGSILSSDRTASGGTQETFTYNPSVGNVVALTDTAGATAQTVRYNAFGNIVGTTGASLNNRLANTKEREFVTDASNNVLLALDNHGIRSGILTA